MKLRCLSRYRNRDTEYTPGQELDISDAAAQVLLADSPSSFEVISDAQGTDTIPNAAALDAPDTDKMVRSARKK